LLVVGAVAPGEPGFTLELLPQAVSPAVTPASVRPTITIRTVRPQAVIDLSFKTRNAVKENYETGGLRDCATPPPSG